ncbi:monovalent cation:proton antiporter-2 (CPA2) family protein [Shimia thalassica]|uniref:K(+)/H(+) antiporter n=1 Tax=Shimia thalassica TaxID=1715693 RepID=A0A0P1I5Z4_9RHOB|nr:monovalent cation:proton antiporter-2 (CPA2) family protein [Shimia thalassica]PHO03595.1 potassium transporter [Rhodobacteraceae bacterium 4F10]MDO6478302.1 monovalent cation:proton antiporter-2 (CPA2) family protein [Shimia thalassica]MDO6522480.1 monovalent cation:proton antiporter-2 (CPA2) family protein [Shimia thalassica]MDO6798147.1 monovalent cation:proton antiporter-2 (CPA2) family protein [Shimia thalassica]MDP2493826.1 monovalent cation:proton antiporter-2 (CPA2) family protein [
MDGVLFQATIFLLAAVIAVPIASRLGMGSVLGYLLAGVIIGPVLGLISQPESLLHYAEFGVVMMLFLIGLELDPRALWAMRHKLLGLGGSQIALTGAAVMIGMLSLGYTTNISIAVGMIFALSSTAIVLQTLSEKNLMKTGGGRSAFSVLLTQDIAVIPMLALLPLLAMPVVMEISTDGSIAKPDHASAHGSMSLVEGLPGWGVTLVTLAVVGAIVLAGMYLVRPIFRFIHAAHLREMYTAFALLIVVGIAFLMNLVGLSPALGTFLAGVLLANSEFRHELESDIEPFKGLLLGLFFITVGAQIDFVGFFADPIPILGVTLGIMLVKAVILFILGRVSGLRGRDQALFTLGLAQAGEFGFVLISFSLQQNVLPADLAEHLMLVVALSMLITPLLFIVYDVLSRRIGDGDSSQQADDKIDEKGPIIIAGIGRFGQIVNRLVRSVGYKTVVLDHDMRTIELMRRFGVKGFFGDPTRPELLHAAGLGEARVLVAALDDPKATTKLVEHARRGHPDLHIVARAHDRNHVYQLYRAGANDIVREMFDSSLRAGRYVLENSGLNEYEAAQAEQAFFQHDRYTLRELADLWNPDIPASENQEYIARAKELEKELEVSLLALLDGDSQDAA